jgi:hypothetical protein
VPWISTIHHALGDVDSSTRDIQIRVDVRNAVDRARMNPHAQLDFGMLAESLAQLQGTADSGFGVAKEDQSHAVAGGQSNELVFGRSTNEFWCVPNRFLQFMEQLLLLLHSQFGIRNDVHE